MSCISECPARPGYLLLHIGAVLVCAGVAGDAVQYFCGRGKNDYYDVLNISVVHATIESHFVSFLTTFLLPASSLSHLPTIRPSIWTNGYDWMQFLLLPVFFRLSVTAETAMQCRHRAA